MTTFRQLLVGASAEDAITGMARRLGGALAGVGRSELYAHHVHPSAAGEVRSLADLPPARRGDVLIYHASYGDPEITRVLLQRHEPLVLVYHNLTPSAFFLQHDPAVAAALEWGRHELELIRPRVALAVAVSPFNAADLERHGYDLVEVVPVGLDPMRLHPAVPDGAMARDLADRFPAGYALWVSQVLPHKRLELLVGAMHLLRWIHQHELGVVIAGANRLPSYWDAMHRYARHLNVPRILFTGVVDDGTLSTLFRRAELFVTTSAHEGLGLPPIEAMSFGVPVITTPAGALPDTVGDAGLVLPADAGPIVLAESMAAVLGDQRLRCEMVRRGFRRSAELQRLGDVNRFVTLLEAVR